MSAPGRINDEISHGRGGAGNITEDKTPYTDGSIVREGPVGDHADGAFSTGRGGHANIGSPGLKPQQRTDEDVIPETAIRNSKDTENFHVGRGGEGNKHVAADADKETPHEGLADKLKKKLFGKK